MVDIYTKIVLTLIGIALCVLAFQAVVPTADAELGVQCGGTGFGNFPCEFKITVHHSGSVTIREF